MLRRVLRWFGWLVLAVIALAAIALAVLHTGWGKDQVRARIEARLASRFHGKVTLGSLDYGFLFSSIELRGLVVRDREGREAIRIERVTADLDRGSLLDGTPVIDRLAITGLAVAVTQDPAGRSNLGGLLVASDRPSTLKALTIRDLRATGTATITRADGTTATVTDLALAGEVTARPIARELAVTLGPTRGALAIARPGAPPRVLPLAIASTRLVRQGTVTDLSIAGIGAGALSIEAVAAHLALGADGQLAGEQSIAVKQMRLDHAQLTALLDRKLVAHDIVVDAQLTGPPGALVVHGVVTSHGAKLALDGTVDASDRLRPRYDLVLAGAGTSADILVAPLPRLPAIGTAIRIGVRGTGATLPTLEAAITLEVGRTTIGAVAVDSVAAAVTANRGTFTLDRFAARGLGLEVDATGMLAADATLAGRMTVAGNPAQVITVLEQAGIAVPRQVPRLPRIELAITALGRLGGDLEIALEPAQLAIAGGSVGLSGKAVLRDRKVASATTTLALRGLDLARLGRIAGRALPVQGSLSGTVALTRTPTGRIVDYDVTVTTARATIHARGRTDGTPASIRARLRDATGTELGTLDARIPVDARGFDPRGAWRVQGELPARSIDELAALLPPRVAAKLPPGVTGDVKVRVDLRGSPAAPRGTIDAVVTGARSATIHATVAPGPKGIVVTTQGTVEAEGITAAIAGTVTVPAPFAGRKLDRAALRAAVIDQTIELAPRPLADLPRVPPRLAALGGSVGGSVRVTGTLPAVQLDGTVVWRDYATADGATGETTVALAGTPKQLRATITHGALALVADIARTPDRIDVRATAQAPETPILPLLPAALGARAPAGASLGTLRVDLRADLGLARTAAGFALDRAVVDGGLRVSDGAFALPGSARTWHDIDLELAGDPRGVRLVGLDLHESDRQLADRRVHAEGVLALAGMRPTGLELVLETHDWLLLGLTSPVFADAPSAALDLRARVTADLTRPVPAVDVTVDALALKAPDRRDRAHQPERPSVSGDVIFVDDPSQVGKLPVPAAPPARALPALDVAIHLPGPAHILRAPLDVMAQGELAIAVRPDGVHPTGTIDLVSGKLNLFGQDHALVRGTITVDAQHPKGWLDLHFERPLPDFAARDLADPAVGARLALTGEPSHPRVGLSGSTNATLPEVFVMYNAGRSVYAPRPTLPASATVQVPRGDQSNVLVFVSLAAPHLLFLDRISAWADASEPRGAYGRIRNLEADRYVRDGRARVRTVGRPTTPGRSTGEVQLDHLLIRSARAALGIGVRAGDRLGGGLGLVFEWSSSR